MNGEIHWLALVAVVAVVLVAVGIGVYVSRVVRTTSDYYVASRAVGPVLNASAISGEYLSAASFLGVAGMVMKFGYDVLWYPVGYAAGYLMLLLFIAAPLRRFGAYTIPDFAEGRFGSRALRRISVAFVLLIGIFYMMPQMKGAGITLQSIIGTPYWVGVVVVGFAITLNVAMGGMKGITFVQAFQFWAKMFAISVPTFAMLLHFGPALADPGSVAPAVVPSMDTWLQPFGPLSSYGGQPLLYTYSLIVAVVFGTAGLPHILVRFYTNRDGQSARQTALSVLALIGTFYVFPPVIGALGRAYAPELYATGVTDSVVLVLPRHVGPGLEGEILAAITAGGAFAAFMSTMSGLMVSVASGISHDIYGTLIKPTATAGERLVAYRASAAIAGIVVIALGLQVEPFDINMLVGWSFAIAASCFFPLLALGTWWARLTRLGAALGVVLGGSLSTLAIAITMLARQDQLAGIGPSVGVLMAQPAIWTMPVAFAVMIGVSLLGPRDVPRDVKLKMVRLHVPESLGIRTDFISE